MNTVTLDNRTFTFPSSWDELSKRQLLNVATVLMMNIPEIQKKIRLLVHFLRLKGSILCYNERNYLVFGRYKYFKWMAIGAIRKGKVRRICDEDLYALSETLNFLFENNELTRQLLPKIKRFYGPDDRLSNVTFIEFAKADKRHRNYVASENEMYLNEMIAILYRPAKKFRYINRFFGVNVADVRQKYSDNCIKNAKRFKYVSRAQKKAVLFYWEGCYSFMISTFPHVFTNGNDGDSDGFGFAGLITELAGTKFGNTDQTADTHIMTILLYLEILAIQQEKQKKITQ